LWRIAAYPATGGISRLSNINPFAVVSPGQVIVFLMILFIAWLSQFLLGRPFKALERRLSKVAWARQLPAVTLGMLPPLIAWILNRWAIQIFQALEWPSLFLIWATPFLTLWFFYRLGGALFAANLSPAQAQLWRRRILLPIAVFTGILYGTGLLDDFLQVGSLAENGLPYITVGSVLAGVAIIVLFIILSRLVWRVLEQGFLVQAGVEPGVAHALSTLTAYGVVAVGVVMGLVVTGFNLTTLTVIAGGLSIGLGFGLQQIVSNLISGFILMFERSIGPGDVIEIGDTMGTVQDIGIRSMILKTANNKEVIIPNSHFLTGIMTNLTRTDRLVRVDIKIGVSYNADPLEVEQALLEAAQHPRVLDEPAPGVQFREFGENKLDFMLQVWTDDPMRIPALASDLRYRMWAALSRHKVEILLPARDGHIRSGPPWEEAATAQQPPVEAPSPPLPGNDNDKSGR
jgi:small-conductance mechanosensitive channel